MGERDAHASQSDIYGGMLPYSSGVPLAMSSVLACSVGDSSVRINKKANGVFAIFSDRSRDTLQMRQSVMPSELARNQWSAVKDYRDDVASVAEHCTSVPGNWGKRNFIR